MSCELRMLTRWVNYISYLLNGISIDNFLIKVLEFVHVFGLYLCSFIFTIFIPGIMFLII